jgi:sugar O-acyltransferase (sialic acid O-acetyltransferase NeuD family)
MRVVIWGAGSVGRIVLDILGYNPKVEVQAFLDDNVELQEKTLEGIPVLNPTPAILRCLKQDQKVDFGIVAIGGGNVRERCSRRLEECGMEIINAIHPSVQISPKVSMGRGVIIQPMSNLSYNPTVGNYVFIGSSVLIAHDSCIKDNVHLSGGCRIGSKVRVGRNAFIGMGATVVSREFKELVVGENAVVSVGAVVTGDVPPNAVVVGVPARVVGYREENE